MAITSTAHTTVNDEGLPVLHQQRVTVSEVYPTKDVEQLEQSAAMTAVGYWAHDPVGDGLRRTSLISNRQYRALATQSLYSGETMLEVLARYRFDGFFALIGKNNYGNAHRIQQNGVEEYLDD